MRWRFIIYQETGLISNLFQLFLKHKVKYPTNVLGYYPNLFNVIQLIESFNLTSFNHA